MFVYVPILFSSAPPERRGCARLDGKWSYTVSIMEFKDDKVMGHEELLLLLHDHLPPEMIYERELLICRL